MLPKAKVERATVKAKSQIGQDRVGEGKAGMERPQATWWKVESKGNEDAVYWEEVWPTTWHPQSCLNNALCEHWVSRTPLFGPSSCICPRHLHRNPATIFGTLVTCPHSRMETRRAHPCWVPFQSTPVTGASDMFLPDIDNPKNPLHQWETVARRTVMEHKKQRIIVIIVITYSYSHPSRSLVSPTLSAFAFSPLL